MTTKDPAQTPWNLQVHPITTNSTNSITPKPRAHQTIIITFKSNCSKMTTDRHPPALPSIHSPWATAPKKSVRRPSQSSPICCNSPKEAEGASHQKSVPTSKPRQRFLPPPIDPTSHPATRAPTRKMPAAWGNRKLRKLAWRKTDRGCTRADSTEELCCQMLRSWGWKVNELVDFSVSFLGIVNCFREECALENWEMLFGHLVWVIY